MLVIDTTDCRRYIGRIGGATARVLCAAIARVRSHLVATGPELECYISLSVAVLVRMGSRSLLGRVEMGTAMSIRQMALRFRSVPTLWRRGSATRRQGEAAGALGTIGILMGTAILAKPSRETTPPAKWNLSTTAMRVSMALRPRVPRSLPPGGRHVPTGLRRWREETGEKRG